MNALVVTDGSCISGTRGERGAGGWAAHVERGSDGWVLRGREFSTSSTQMELRAVIEGLRSLADGETVELRTDCMAVLGVEQRWRDGVFDGDPDRNTLSWRIRHYNGVNRKRKASADWFLWADVAAELTRLDVTIGLVTGPETLHSKVHVIAQGEARAANAGRTDEVPLPIAGKKKKPEVARHHRGCTPAMCIVNCPVLRRKAKAELHAQERARRAAQFRENYFGDIPTGRKRRWSNTDYQADGA